MYQFYYDYLKPKYGDRCHLLFTDTDSLCCEIKTHDLYDDVSQNLDLFDTSNFDQNHPLYSTANHRILGKFYSETGSVAPKEFVGLRAKMYSVHVSNDIKKCQKKAKGMDERRANGLEDSISLDFSYAIAYVNRQTSSEVPWIAT